MERIIELKKLLLEAELFPWNEHVYMAKDGDWSLVSKCFLFDLNDLADDEEDPCFAKENNLRCVLSVADVQDIVLNMKQQKANCSVQELFDAFIYYFNNDAFINCDKM